MRIEQEQYKLVKSYLLDLAVRRSAESLESVLRGLPFEPYAPVRRQLLNILRAVNRARKVAGFNLVRGECLRLRRKIVKPFDGEGEELSKKGREDETAIGELSGLPE